MKKAATLIAVGMVAAVLVARAQTPVDSHGGGAKMVSEINAAFTAQSDNAATNTALSSYTSRYVGDILVGKLGTTNWCWVAATAGVTNAWGNGWAR